MFRASVSFNTVNNKFKIPNRILILQDVRARCAEVVNAIEFNGSGTASEIFTGSNRLLVTMYR